MQCHFMHWLCFLIWSVNYLRWSSKYGTLMMLVGVGSCLIFVCGGTGSLSSVHLLVISKYQKDMACDSFLEQARSLFADSLVSVTADGRPYLGAAVGSLSYVGDLDYVNCRIDSWVAELKILSSFAATQPHAAFSAFSRGLISKWLYSLPELSFFNLKIA